MRIHSKERVRTGFVLMVLICAVLVRFSLAWGAASEPAAPTDAPQAAQKTSLRPELTQMPEAQPLPETQQAAPSSTVSAPSEPQFHENEAALIRVAGACSYRPDVTAALQGLWRSADEGAPTVLIVHTHGTESYTAEAGWEYEGSESLRTTDANYSVVRVGRAVAASLRAQGIEVIHDETMHDEKSFAGAYNASRKAVQNALQEYPQIDLVIDLHRDAALNPDGSAYAPTISSDGTEYARVMLVVGTDEGGLSHPDWQKNFSCAVQLQALLNRSLPGLCRDLDLRTERFNQDLSPGALLIEMGAAGNTLEQVLCSAEILAQAVVQLLGT